MIGNNLFRSLPPPVYEDFDPEEDEPNFDPSWYMYVARMCEYACLCVIGHTCNSCTSSSTAS